MHTPSTPCGMVYTLHCIKMHRGEGAKRKDTHRAIHFIEEAVFYLTHGIAVGKHLVACAKYMLLAPGDSHTHVTRSIRRAAHLTACPCR